jgi:hypothetical protein
MCPQPSCCWCRPCVPSPQCGWCGAISDAAPAHLQLGPSAEVRAAQRMLQNVEYHVLTSHVQQACSPYCSGVQGPQANKRSQQTRQSTRTQPTTVQTPQRTASTGSFPKPLLASLGPPDPAGRRRAAPAARLFAPLALPRRRVSISHAAAVTCVVRRCGVRTGPRGVHRTAGRVEASRSGSRRQF